MRMLNLIGSRKKGRHPKWKDSHEQEQSGGRSEVFTYSMPGSDRDGIYVLNLPKSPMR